jgi:hypothetical protein
MKTFDKAASALEHLASDCAQYDLVITDYRKSIQPTLEENVKYTIVNIFTSII